MKTALTTAFAAAAGLLACACTGQGHAAPRATVTVTARPAASASTATQPPAAAGGSAGGSQVTSQTGPASAPPATAPGCLTRYLGYKVGLTQGTAGATYVVIEFKNLDNVPCTLYGYPGVSQGAGKPVTQVGLAATEDPATPRELVTLAPHGYANAVVQIRDAGNYPAATCDPVTAPWLQVIPPNQTVPLYVYYNSTACAKPVHLLSVQAVRPGTGG